jgi:2-oxoglutarate-Fe(II)-dependent oxygenase superfamily protein
MDISLSSYGTIMNASTTQNDLEPDPPEINSVRIRGVDLPQDKLVDSNLFEPAARTALRERLVRALPFPHLVLEGVFNPGLLNLIRGEFDSIGDGAWEAHRDTHENTHRSMMGARLGPASQLYFDIVNSGWFTEWISSITNVPYLLPDPKLFGGGLHESRTGGHFAVHRDFHYHRFVGLKNEMVFITYLNKDWRPEWGGALELWDRERKQCEVRIQPEFGHSVLMLHGPASFHGHPTPLSIPEGQTRRSVTAYYYTSPHADQPTEDEIGSRFLSAGRLYELKRLARMLTPPLLWSAVRRLK